MDELITPKELAMRWKLSTKTIYQKISNGDDMPRSMLLGQSRRFRLHDVQQWEKRHEEDSCI